MFKINDYVVYSSTGVCQIIDIRQDEITNNETEYYILQPVFNDKNMIIKIPVNNPVLPMRAILTKDEALSLINTMPEVEPILVDDRRERTKLFNSILKSRKCEEYLKIIKTLHLEKDAKAAIGKTLSKSDEDLMNTAEKSLFEELAIALDSSPEEVLSCILEHFPHNHQST